MPTPAEFQPSNIVKTEPLRRDVTALVRVEIVRLVDLASIIADDAATLAENADAITFADVAYGAAKSLLHAANRDDAKEAARQLMAKALLAKTRAACQFTNEFDVLEHEVRK